MASVNITKTKRDDPVKYCFEQDSFMYEEKNYHSKSKEKLVKYRKEESYTDIVLIAGSVEIPCHKLILATGSPYFHTLFRKGHETGVSNRVDLKDINSDIVEAIVDFFYTGRILISTENMQAICKACDQFDLPHLKQSCDQFMSKNVGPTNCFGLIMFARSNMLEMTLKAAMLCMVTNPKEILTLALESEYRMLSENALIEYISKDELEVEDEATVFELVTKWVEADKENRESSFENVLEHVRLPFCTTAFLCDTVDLCPLVDSRKCFNLIREAKNYHLLPERRQDTVTPRTKPRKLFSKPPTKDEKSLPDKAGPTTIKKSNIN